MTSDVSERQKLFLNHFWDFRVSELMEIVCKLVVAFLLLRRQSYSFWLHFSISEPSKTVWDLLFMTFDASERQKRFFSYFSLFLCFWATRNSLKTCVVIFVAQKTVLEPLTIFLWFWAVKSNLEASNNAQKTVLVSQSVFWGFWATKNCLRLFDVTVKPQKTVSVSDLLKRNLRISDVSWVPQKTVLISKTVFCQIGF